MSFLINSYRFAVPLLDAYTSAAGAYSLRQLRTGVNNVVRVRRSSDNTEQDFTPAQIINGTLIAFCGAGNGFVTTWYDQSGNNRNFSQATALSQPQIVSSGSLFIRGGKPFIRFNSQTLTGSVPLGGSQGLFIVFNLPSTITSSSAPLALIGKLGSPYHYVYLGSVSSKFDNERISWLTGGTGNALVYGYTQTSEDVPQGLHILSLLWNTEASMYRNNVLKTTPATPDGGFPALPLVPPSIQVIGSDSGIVELSEVIAYASDVASIRDPINSSINTYYGIY